MRKLIVTEYEIRSNLLATTLFTVVALAPGRRSELDIALDFNPYIILGTIDNEEDDHCEATAHKFMIGLGFDFMHGREFKQTLGARIWVSLSRQTKIVSSRSKDSTRLWS